MENEPQYKPVSLGSILVYGLSTLISAGMAAAAISGQGIIPDCAAAFLSLNTVYLGYRTYGLFRRPYQSYPEGNDDIKQEND